MVQSPYLLSMLTKTHKKQKHSEAQSLNLHKEIGVTTDWLPQTAGSPIPVRGGDAAAVPPFLQYRDTSREAFSSSDIY